MQWLLFSCTLAAGAWSASLNRVEKSATNIKIGAKNLEKIANAQLKKRQIDQIVGLMTANKMLNEEIADAKRSLEGLKRASQK